MINNLKVLTIYLHHQRIRIIVLSYILFLEKKEFFLSACTNFSRVDTDLPVSLTFQCICAHCIHKYIQIQAQTIVK